MEFITAFLNNAANDNDLKSGAELAKLKGIRLVEPKFGFSRSGYFFDKENRVIAKGLSAVKYMSESTADELYALSREKKYTSFIDLLYDIGAKTHLNARQLDILIKIDFFSQFGNQRELFRLVDLFTNTFNHGNAKQIKRSAVDGTPLEPIVKRYAVGTTKAGGVAKSYTLLDVESILKEAEKAVLAVHMEDLSDIVKVQNFKDAMGYVGYISGEEKDRRKLYVTGIKPIKRRDNGKIWAYSTFTKSIGSGKESRFTVPRTVYDKNPIKEGEIVYCHRFERDGQYYRMTDYEKIV